MRAWAALLVLAAPLLADGDVERSYREEMKRCRAAEQRFWEEFQRRYNDAYLAFREPIERATAKPAEHPNPDYDYSHLRALYEECAGIERARGEAALALAKSGHAKALDAAFDMMMDAAKEVDALEAELLDAKPIQRRYMFDLRPGVRRHGVGVREEWIVQALAAAPSAAAFLVDAG
ncbi:MAG: hypothetical protein ACREID_07665, partial [Planctomycetota bacterium]